MSLLWMSLRCSRLRSLTGAPFAFCQSAQPVAYEFELGGEFRFREFVCLFEHDALVIELHQRCDGGTFISAPPRRIFLNGAHAARDDIFFPAETLGLCTAILDGFGEQYVGVELGG